MKAFKKSLLKIVSLALAVMLVSSNCIFADSDLKTPDESFENVSLDGSNDLIDKSASSTRYAQLVGVVNTGHDHTTWTIPTQTELSYCNLTYSYIHTGAFSEYEIGGYLNTNTNAAFISRSHGEVVYSSGVQIGTRIWINNSLGSPVYFSSNSSFSGLNLSNLDLALFIGCHTGEGGASVANLPSRAYVYGAKTAIGFSGTINCSKANEWVADFCGYMRMGYTAQAACYTLGISSYYGSTGLQNWVLCGTGLTTLN